VSELSRTDSVRRLTEFFRASAWREPAQVNALAIALLTAASAIFLAWSASLCLRVPPYQAARGVQRFTIVVSGSAKKVPDNGTLITRLLADGKALRGEDAELKGDWVSYWDRTLSHPNTTELASISFNARSAVVLFDRLNHCGHLSISGPDGTIWKDTSKDCDRGGRYRRFLAVDLPAPARRPHWSLVVWLAAFLILAAVTQSWTSRRRLEVWLLIYLAVLHLLFWSTQPVGLLTDSLKQLPTLKANILLGAPAYFPPGYPMLVGLAYFISRTLTGSVITMLSRYDDRDNLVVLQVAPALSRNDSLFRYRPGNRRRSANARAAAGDSVGECRGLWNGRDALFLVCLSRDRADSRWNPRRPLTRVGHIGPRGAVGGRPFVGTRDHDRRRASRGRSP
jgi:hypothetical protein